MPNVWKLRQEICEIGRRMYERGLVAAFEGNLSARLGPDRVLCTPTGVCKGLLKPDDLCIVDMSGNQIGQGPGFHVADRPARKRSSEILLHLAIYRERSDVEAVVHTHAPHAVAFAITHTEVPQCVTAEVEVFLGPVPIAPYATPGTAKLGDVVTPLVREANALLLANHGVVSWGASLEEAFNRTEILEAYCRTLILARQLGPIQRLSDENMRELMAAKQQLGLADPRGNSGKFENCDLGGNNVFGRGFCASQGQAAVKSTQPAAGDSMPAHVQPIDRRTGQSNAQAADLESIVREIADRVSEAMGRAK